MSFCKKPCKTCPFRIDVTPFLHPKRAMEIAYSAQMRFSDFPCHNTVKYTDEEDYFGNDVADLSESKTCAGFLTMRAQDGGFVPDGFEPDFSICYTDPYEMYQVYSEEYNLHKTKINKLKTKENE